jgi:hypothetical protein
VAVLKVKWRDHRQVVDKLRLCLRRDRLGRRFFPFDPAADALVGAPLGCFRVGDDRLLSFDLLLEFANLLENMCNSGHG